MGRDDLSCSARVAAIERAAQAIEGRSSIVAHSGGCIMLAHWAQRQAARVRGALLATPPDFEKPMPDGYPTIDALRAGGWLPVPRAAAVSQPSSRRAATTRSALLARRPRWPATGAPSSTTSASSAT
jgi:pimeloyl-ACP methyl ester carboxylesterase